MPRYIDNPTIYIQSSTIKDFPTPGCCAWTVPSGITQVTFEVWGSGGGGGGRCCCGCYRASTGGAGGGYSKKTIAVSAGSVYTICVGAGGMVPAVGSCTWHWCCFGGDGQASYVTGTNLSNFCASGGCGGNNYCYQQCGCITYGVGMGYGGDVNKQGTPGLVGTFSDFQPYTFSKAGAAPFTANHNWQSFESCCTYAYCACNPGGNFPGGGGQGPASTNCCCCMPAHTGANGLVRVYY